MGGSRRFPECSLPPRGTTAGGRHTRRHSSRNATVDTWSPAPCGGLKVVKGTTSSHSGVQLCHPVHPSRVRTVFRATVVWTATCMCLSGTASSAVRYTTSQNEVKFLRSHGNCTGLFLFMLPPSHVSLGFCLLLQSFVGRISPKRHEWWCPQCAARDTTHSRSACWLRRRTEHGVHCPSWLFWVFVLVCVGVLVVESLVCCVRCCRRIFWERVAALLEHPPMARMHLTGSLPCSQCRRRAGGDIF